MEGEAGYEMEGGEEAEAAGEEADAVAVSVSEAYRSAWRRMVSAVTAASDFTMETEAGTSDARARVQVDGSAGEIKVPDADGDDDAAKLQDALKEAQRRARDHAQSCLKDVPSYSIQVDDITEESFDHLMTQLSKRMRDVCSLMLGEHPVTPPLVDGNDLFQIVKLCKGDDSVEMLFRESDLYFCGFRPEKAPKYYVFSDVEIPDWIPSEFLPYDAGYNTTVANISLGPHCFPAKFKHMFNFTPENFRSLTTDRQNAVHWSMLNLSETRRIRSMNRKVKGLLRIGGADTVGSSLDNKVHGWGHESSKVFAAAKSDDVNWELTGFGADLITLKFNEQGVLPIIIGRQKRVAEAAAATLNEITILLKTHFSIDSNQACNWEQLHYYSQLPNFHIYLVFLLAHEKFRQETSSPVVTTILSRLLPILRSSEGLDNIVVGNTAITLGRLSLVWPMIVSAHLKRSMQAWCNALCMARGDLEKEDGFSGLCEMVEANLSRAVGSLAHVCRAFASLKDIQSEALPSKVRGALNNLKQSAGDARWEQCMSTLDPSEVQRLASLMAEIEPQ